MIKKLSYYKEAVVRFRELSAITKNPRQKREYKNAANFARRRVAEIESEVFNVY